MNEDELTKRERRELRKEQQRKEASRRKRRARIIRWSTGLGIPAALAGVIWVSAGSTEPFPGTVISDQGRKHVIGKDHEPYLTYPPTSGPHSPSAERWGIFDQEVPEEVQVHNLEHGGVFVQYNCSAEPALNEKDCDTLIGQLTEIVEGYSTKVNLAPYTNMADRIALTSWGRIDTMMEFDRDRVSDFVKRLRNKGPEFVPG